MIRAALAVVVVLAALAQASVPYSMDSLEDLYLQRLYQMEELQGDPYLPLLPIDDIDGRSDEAIEAGQPLWDEEDDGGDVKDPIYNSAPLFTGAQARDQEHLEHSALQGLHQVSGGTAEGEPPQKQVKTDKPLPAYCNPPNPCPVGKTETKARKQDKSKETQPTAADNCVMNFENSMENNKRLLERQDCPCDTEHMLACPAGQQTVTSKGAGGQAALSKVMSELAQLRNAAGMTMDGNPYLTSGLKREKLVAKKSPGMVRRKRSQEQFENPFFGGPHKNIAAKKSPKYFEVRH